MWRNPDFTLQANNKPRKLLNTGIRGSNLKSYSICWLAQKEKKKTSKQTNMTKSTYLHLVISWPAKVHLLPQKRCNRSLRWDGCTDSWLEFLSIKRAKHDMYHGVKIGKQDTSEPQLNIWVTFLLKAHLGEGLPKPLLHRNHKRTNSLTLVINLLELGRPLQETPEPWGPATGQRNFRSAHSPITPPSRHMW